MSDGPNLQLVHRASGNPQRVQELGPYQVEALLDRSEAGAGTVYRIRIAPGQKTSTSYHRIAEEYYFILAGSGVAVLDGREQPLQAGNFLRLPPGTTHCFLAGPDGLDMLDIHTPGCFPDHDTYFVDGKPDGFA
jgi:mannose-6-phosphate isomerase-like protein (cupin superfamily)